MTKTGKVIEDSKERGEWAELRFMARAKEEGFRVTKPWGESARYDFALEVGGQFLRVQVKSTICRRHIRHSGYECALHTQGKPYTAEQVDFFALYLIPENLWYVLPADIALRLKGTIVLTPTYKAEKYAAYREAWHLMKKALAQQARDAIQAKAKHKRSKPEANQLEETTDPEAGGQPADIEEMRGAVEAPPAVGFDPDLLRSRLAGCFARLNRR